MVYIAPALDSWRSKPGGLLQFLASGTDHIEKWGQVRLTMFLRAQ